MTIPQFVDGTVLTAAQLNALVGPLNQLEQVYVMPAPLFQRLEIGTPDHPGSGGTTRYIILHKAVNRYLRYRWEWLGTGGSPSSALFVGDNPTSYGLGTGEGVHDGSVDLSTIPSIGGSGGTAGAGKLYLVRLVVDLSTRTYFKFHFLFEGPNL